jgi:WD40 repeat protein
MSDSPLDERLLLSEPAPDGVRVALVEKATPIRILVLRKGTDELQIPVVNEQHVHTLLRLCWSPDGTRIASADAAGNVQVWDAQSGESIVTFRHHLTSVFWLAWSPDGTRIASESISGEIYVWHAETGHIQSSMRHPHGLTGIAWSPDGAWLATFGLNGWVCVWDASSGHARATYTRQSSCYRLSWSPDGAWLATCWADKSVRLYRTTDWKLDWTVDISPGTCASIEWSAEDGTVRFTFFDHTSSFFNLETGEVIPSFTCLPRPAEH